MKSKELRVYNLPGDSFFVSEINAKPTFLFIFVVLIGITMLFFPISRIYGSIIILTGLCCICFMPKVVLIEFYNDFLILHNKADKNTCTIVYYDEVKSWRYVWGTAHDYLLIELIDGSQEKIEAFSKTIFEMNMSHFLKDKHVKKHESSSN